jgi:geranylgeranyl diphosphate synthase type II
VTPPTAQRVSTVPAVLEEVSRRIGAELSERIPGGEPAQWLYDVAREYPARPAKHLRPAICFAACEAFGGSRDEVVELAVAIEMLHNAFLVHDDIADGSERRRGESTLHTRHGVGLALNAGDALAVLAHRCVREGVDRLPVALADRVVHEFDTMMTRTLEGQATELGWVRDVVVDLTPEDYLDLIMHKTCWYTTIHPLRVGAIVGSRGRLEVEPMVRFGFYLGAAFQIRDDVLNLIGAEETYGKEISGDLFEGKRTLMLIHLISEAEGADRRLLVEYLHRDRSNRDPAMVLEVRTMMDRYGSVEFALNYAQGIADAATRAFETAFADARDNDASTFIRDLVPFMLERST